MARLFIGFARGFARARFGAWRDESLAFLVEKRFTVGNSCAMFITSCSSSCLFWALIYFLAVVAVAAAALRVVLRNRRALHTSTECDTLTL